MTHETEQAILKTIGDVSVELGTALVALIRDALAGEPTEVIAARAERIAVLKGYRVSVAAEADHKRDELRKKGRS